jgi:hypothetical protein
MRGVEVLCTSTLPIWNAIEIEIQILFTLKKKQGGFHHERFYYLFISCGQAPF